LKYVLSERRVSVDTLKEEKHISDRLVKSEGAQENSPSAHLFASKGYDLDDLTSQNWRCSAIVVYDPDWFDVLYQHF